MKKFLLVVLVLFASCTNPFVTREPEPPAVATRPQPGNTLQNNPDSLLLKLQYAFRDKNVNFYTDCLSDGERVTPAFYFVPSQNEAQRFPFWSRRDEYYYFNQLATNSDLEKMSLQLFNVADWTYLGASQDTMQTNFAYEIQLKFKLRREIYRGEGVFKIVRSSQSLWYIYYWEDFEKTAGANDSTWSTLKINYR